MRLSHSCQSHSQWKLSEPNRGSERLICIFHYHLGVALPRPLIASTGVLVTLAHVVIAGFLSIFQ